MKLTSKHVSIATMISMTMMLAFMDLKDIYYKINMCGPYPTFSFLLTTPEIVTDYDVTKAIKEANGSWISPTNQWNALALQCDALYVSLLQGKPAHLSSLGVGCTLGGVKRNEELMFIGAHRVDTFLWATMILAEVIHAPLQVVPYSSDVYAAWFNLPEREFAQSLAAIIDPADIPAINATIRKIAETYVPRRDTWSTALCYEAVEMVAPGEMKDHVGPIEHGCIWSNVQTGETVAFHVDKVAGKYYRHLVEVAGITWHTFDYLTPGHGIFLRARLYMKTWYKIEQTLDGDKLFWHFNESDLGVDGALYMLLMVLEIFILMINATDVGTVAVNVVRPIYHSTFGTSSLYSTHLSTKVGGASSRNVTSTAVASSDDASRRVSGATAPKKEEKNSAKEDTLSKMLLYTDLTSVSYRKPFLAALMVMEALLAWLYVMPNSYVFAWASSFYQLGSAYLSMFRIWVLVLIVIDQTWKWTVVFWFEKLAALITELTYVTSFEIMCSTLIGIYLCFDDIMNISLFKYGFVDGQRGLSPTTPALLSYYCSYSKYSYLDRSHEGMGLDFIYGPLGSILSYGILFSGCVVVARLIVRVAFLKYKGTLGGELESFWRNYQRNSVEVFMNDPLRANALIRSQQMMSYRFGKAVFIRPFVYLEQNYYITKGKFRARPAIPFLSNEDASLGADVDTKSYMLADVYRDEQSMKLQRKHTRLDVQIPLC